MLHRRTGLALTATALAAPAFAWAQTAQQAQTGQQAQSNDRMMVAAASHFSMSTARIGAERATRPEVRRFAQLEIAEQEAAMAALSLAGVSTPRDMALPAEKARLLQELQAERGQGFDAAFLNGQKAGHEELLALHQRVAQSAETQGERMIAILAVPAIRSHLAMIEMLQARAG